MSKCKFDIAWRGTCNAECAGTFCDKHAAVKCSVCGEQATNECNHTGQFVCGTRLHNALGGNGGVIPDVDCLECDTYVKRFRHLWESTGGDWAANPWVWVIDFKRIEKP